MDQTFKDLLSDESASGLAWELLKALKLRSPAKSSHGQVRKYTTYIRHYTCLHCGSRWVSRCEITRGEFISVIEKGGEISTLGFRGAKTLEVSTHCSRCSKCRLEISRWSREKLELSYLLLLSRLPYTETGVGEGAAGNCGLSSHSAHGTVTHQSGMVPEQLSLW
jgi:transcription elongation factor Elf1